MRLWARKYIDEIMFLNIISIPWGEWSYILYAYVFHDVIPPTVLHTRHAGS